MSVYLCKAPFTSVLSFLHGFNGQFLMLYIFGMLYSPVSDHLPLYFMVLFQGYLPPQFHHSFLSKTLGSII
jgi:hypothetical protein